MAFTLSKHGMGSVTEINKLPMYKVYFFFKLIEDEYTKAKGNTRTGIRGH